MEAYFDGGLKHELFNNNIRCIEIDDLLDKYIESHPFNNNIRCIEISVTILPITASRSLITT